MIEGWTTSSESVHLRFGQEYHSALQDFEITRAEGVEHEAALHIAVEQLIARTVDWSVDQSTKPGKYKNRESLVGLVIDYLDHYKEDPATTFIKADGAPAVELSFRFELDFGPRAGEYKSTEEVYRRAWFRWPTLPPLRPPRSRRLLQRCIAGYGP